MSSTIFRNTNFQAGNALFLVLIAVVLFAGLSYAVTQSTRSGSVDSPKEKTKLVVSQLYNFFSELDNALVRVQTANACTDAEVGFIFTVNDTGGGISGTATNAVSGMGLANIQAIPIAGSEWGNQRRADGTCDLFGPNGGGVSIAINAGTDGLQMLDKNLSFSSLFIALTALQTLTAQKELPLQIRAGASSPFFFKLCEEINRREELPYPLNSSANWSGPGAGDYWGKKTFCKSDGSTTATIYHIIGEK